jgi:hypothetical protein
MLVCQIVEEELNNAATSLQEDVDLMQGQYVPQYKKINGQAGDARTLAILFRIEKKKILFAALESMSKV